MRRPWLLVCTALASASAVAIPHLPPPYSGAWPATGTASAAKVGAPVPRRPVGVRGSVPKRFPQANGVWTGGASWPVQPGLVVSPRWPPLLTFGPPPSFAVPGSPAAASAATPSAGAATPSAGPVTQSSAGPTEQAVETSTAQTTEAPFVPANPGLTPEAAFKAAYTAELQAGAKPPPSGSMPVEHLSIPAESTTVTSSSTQPSVEPTQTEPPVEPQPTQPPAPPLPTTQAATQSSPPTKPQSLQPHPGIALQPYWPPQPPPPWGHQYQAPAAPPHQPLLGSPQLAPHQPLPNPFQPWSLPPQRPVPVPASIGASRQKPVPAPITTPRPVIGPSPSAPPARQQPSYTAPISGADGAAPASAVPSKQLIETSTLSEAAQHEAAKNAWFERWWAEQQATSVASVATSTEAPVFTTKPALDTRASASTSTTVPPAVVSQASGAASSAPVESTTSTSGTASKSTTSVPGLLSDYSVALVYDPWFGVWPPLDSASGATSADPALDASSVDPALETLLNQWSFAAEQAATATGSGSNVHVVTANAAEVAALEPWLSQWALPATGGSSTSASGTVASHKHAGSANQQQHSSFRTVSPSSTVVNTSKLVSSPRRSSAATSGPHVLSSRKPAARADVSTKGKKETYAFRVVDRSSNPFFSGLY